MASATFAVFGAVFAAAVSLGVAAVAQEGAESVKARQSLMKQNSDNMKAIGAVVKGTGSESLDDLKRRAGEISASAAKIPAAFSAEIHTGNASAGVETYALPVIWTDKAKFDEAAKALETKSAALADATDIDGARSAFAEVGKTCSGCHNTFRQKKN